MEEERTGESEATEMQKVRDTPPFTRYKVPEGHLKFSNKPEDLFLFAHSSQSLLPRVKVKGQAQLESKEIWRGKMMEGRKVTADWKMVAEMEKEREKLMEKMKMGISREREKKGRRAMAQWEMELLPKQVSYNIIASLTLYTCTVHYCLYISLAIAE